jgi:hypothetical protein
MSHAHEADSSASGPSSSVRRLIRAAFAVTLLALTVTSASAQLSVATISLRQTTGRVVLCVTKDSILVAAVDAGNTVSAKTLGAATGRPPAIVPLGMGRIGVVMGATDWTRNDAKPTLLDEQLPTLVKQAYASIKKVDPLNPSADDIESIGISILEYLRPWVSDIHYKLDLGKDDPIVEIVLAGYTQGYGPEIWDLRYRVQQKNLTGDYWETTPLRPGYYQLYPPEKGEPKTFVEAQYPTRVEPLGLLRATQSDPAVGRIGNSSPGVTAAVASIVKGESVKADTRPAEDFMRLAIPALAGAQSKMTMAAINEQSNFQWVLTPEGQAAPPQQTGPQPDRPREVQTERPTLGTSK